MGWVDRVGPDVVCLQETKVSDRQFPRREFEQRGYQLVLGGNSTGQGGVAIASKIEMDDITIGIPGAQPPLDELRTISATLRLRTRHKALRLHTVYGPNGRKVGTPAHQIKLAWLELFRQWIEMDGLSDAVATLVLGDINVAPTDRDVWEPSRYRRRNLTSPKEREAFSRLLDSGLVDLVRAQFGEEQVFTWWNRRSDFYATDRGWRLDHALADSETASRVVTIKIDRAARGELGASDHAPVVVELDS